MLILKSYQTKAVEELYNDITGFINSKEKIGDISVSNDILLKAPTGAGKTIIMASAIDKMIQGYNNMAFIWLSIGKGSLHLQSAKKLKKMASYTNVLTSEDVVAGTVNRLAPGDVLFMSWEQLNSKNKNNEWTNVLMREGEGGSLPEILKETGRNKTQIIMIVDESHTSAGTDRAIELAEIINPVVRVSVSATPLLGDYYTTILVRTADVIADGMIKSSLSINQDIICNVDDNGNLIEGDGTKADVVTSLLGTAIGKRNTLRSAYALQKSRINPLILIQIPNADEGNAMLNSILTTLEEVHDITYENGKLAAWFSSDVAKKNLEGIEENNAKQECLIFKTAIDTGWDCPRAQILVKFRLMQSENFARQIIGRILRMPEQKHYKAPQLNIAYIYTNEESFQLDTNNDTESFKQDIEVRDATLQPQQQFRSINTLFPTMKLPKNVTPTLNTIYLIKNVLTSIKQNWDEMVAISDSVSDMSLGITGYTKISTEELEDEDKDFHCQAESLELVRDEAQLEIQLKRIIGKTIKSQNRVQEIFGYLKEFRGSLMVVSRGRRKKNFFFDYYKILVCNEQLITEYLNLSLEDTKSWRYPYIEKAQIETNFVGMSRTLNVPERCVITRPKNKGYYEECTNSGSKTVEDQLQKWDAEKDVDFWYPNWAISDGNLKVRFASYFNGTWGYITPQVIVKRGTVNTFVFFVHDDFSESLTNDALNSPLMQGIKAMPSVDFEVISLHKQVIQPIGSSSNANVSSGLTAATFGLINSNASAATGQSLFGSLSANGSTGQKLDILVGQLDLQPVAQVKEYTAIEQAPDDINNLIEGLAKMSGAGIFDWFTSK